MIQTCEPKTRTSPARRRPSAPLPILISIPTLATGPRAPRTRVRRRRLRREVRVAVYLLLILMPLSMAFATLTADRRPFLTSSPVAEKVELSEPLPAVSLSPLEPIVVNERQVEEPVSLRQADEPVILPGLLLPVDAPEESSDGGH
jgi:hypothetical protein